jgi:PIN domain nuclease of toxin-antitoxin system
VRLLLDTHIFIWACVEPERLSPIEQSVVAGPDNLSSFILGQSMIVRHVTFPIKPPPP